MRRRSACPWPSASPSPSRAHGTVPRRCEGTWGRRVRYLCHNADCPRREGGGTQVAPLQRHVAVRDRDHDHLELLRGGAEGQQQGQNIINACGVRASVRLGGGRSVIDASFCREGRAPGSVSIMMRFLGAMVGWDGGGRRRSAARGTRVDRIGVRGRMEGQQSTFFFFSQLLDTQRRKREVWTRQENSPAPVGREKFICTSVCNSPLARLRKSLRCSPFARQEVGRSRRSGCGGSTSGSLVLRVPPFTSCHLPHWLAFSNQRPRSC